MSGAVTSIKISKWSRKAPEVRDVVPIEKGAFFVSLFHHCEMRSSAALKIGSIIPLPSTYYYSLSTQASSLITNTYRQTQRKSKKKIPIGTGRAPSTWSPTLSNLTPSLPFLISLFGATRDRIVECSPCAVQQFWLENVTLCISNLHFRSCSLLLLTGSWGFPSFCYYSASCKD